MKDTETQCDCCENIIREKDGMLAKGYRNNKLELICQPCADNLEYFEHCNKSCPEDDFSYGQDICDDCCDLKADRLADND